MFDTVFLNADPDYAIYRNAAPDLVFALTLELVILHFFFPF
jgi:hypothetical protein